MRIASLDIGLKRIGLALSLDSSIVTPLKPIIRKNRNQASKEVFAELQKWEIQKLVVGLPIDSIDREEMFRRFSHFISLLNFQGEIIFQDEDYSSIEAKESIKGIIKQKRDGRIDSLSAKIILERFLKNLK
jgi:putative Holliday junction resolvase